ncbi:MAG: class I SAM-dependent methyltransferase [Actinobacteria bacterium]|nr:class I SAM-dependent methyltransferase [Actinomycetota bacterium]
MADDPRKRTVQAGYDAMAEHYLVWGGEIEGDRRHRFLDEFARRLPDGARVLDLGCGAGIPTTKQLAGRFAVVGADISEAQLRLARANVPNATFIHGDFAELHFVDEEPEGEVAFLWVLAQKPAP